MMRCFIIHAAPCIRAGGFFMKGYIMTTILPRDAHNHVIPALRLRDGGAHRITASAVSARNTVSFSPETRIVSLYATGPVYLRVGGAAVTAASSDHFFPAGIYYDISIGGGDVR